MLSNVSLVLPTWHKLCSRSAHLPLVHSINGTGVTSEMQPSGVLFVPRPRQLRQGPSKTQSSARGVADLTSCVTDRSRRPSHRAKRYVSWQNDDGAIEELMQELGRDLECLNSILESNLGAAAIVAHAVIGTFEAAKLRSKEWPQPGPIIRSEVVPCRRHTALECIRAACR